MRASKTMFKTIWAVIHSDDTIYAAIYPDDLVKPFNLVHIFLPYAFTNYHLVVTITDFTFSEYTAASVR